MPQCRGVAQCTAGRPAISAAAWSADNAGMTASVRQIAPQRLVSLARAFQIREAAEAAGRCLGATLDVALEAQARLGLDVNLIRWRVVADPHYMDHWAILLDDGRVLDPTRVQVDGKRLLVGPAQDYPPHFVDARVYPASMLAGRYRKAHRCPDGRLGSGFMWSCAVSLLAHDLRAAARHHDAGAAAVALRSGLLFLRCFLLQGAKRALIRRAERLLARLSGEPVVPADRHGRAESGVGPSRRVG